MSIISGFAERAISQFAGQAFDSLGVSGAHSSQNSLSSLQGYRRLLCRQHAKLWRTARQCRHSRLGGRPSGYRRRFSRTVHAGRVAGEPRTR